MVTFNTNQRRSVKYSASGNWVEEVLAASGVEFANAGFTVVTGSTVQDVLKAVDNVFNGFEVNTASGVVMIDDVTGVSGVALSTLGALDTVMMQSGSDSVVRFSFTVPMQPIDPVIMRLAYAPATSGISGNVEMEMKYSIFQQNVDVSATGYAYTPVVVDQVLATGDYNKMKLMEFFIPAASFSTAGSAPYVVTAQIRKVNSVAGAYAGNLQLIQLVADGVPGGVAGNQPGYNGGPLHVTGNATIDNKLILLASGVTVPTGSGSTGEKGLIVYDSNYLYIAVAEGSWRRASIAAF